MKKLYPLLSVLFLIYWSWYTRFSMYQTRRKLPGFVRFRTRPVTPENINPQLQIAMKWEQISISTIILMDRIGSDSDPVRVVQLRNADSITPPHHIHMRAGIRLYPVTLYRARTPGYTDYGFVLTFLHLPHHGKVPRSKSRAFKIIFYFLCCKI